MTGSARLNANRRNAKLGTGPRSAAGKTRSARNAFRHGLAVPLSMLPKMAPLVAALSSCFAGPDPNAGRLELATRVAEAQVDLNRIRRFRLNLLRTHLDDPVNQDAMALHQLAVPLLRLARYERRARSRRKFAIRALDHLGS